MQLSRDTVQSRSFPERVLQFGEGNFLRAFVDWMIHRMNEQHVFSGSAVVVQPLETGSVDLLNEQGGYIHSIYEASKTARRSTSTS